MSTGLIVSFIFTVCKFLETMEESNVESVTQSVSSATIPSTVPNINRIKIDVPAGTKRIVVTTPSGVIIEKVRGRSIL